MFKLPPLKQQIANFKIPDHGVEFFFDRKTMEWDNKETTSGEFKLTTLTGLVVALPNFYTTFQTSQCMQNVLKNVQKSETNGDIFYFKFDLKTHKLVPIIWIDESIRDFTRGCIECDIFTGTWHLEVGEVCVRDIIHAMDNDHQNKRLAKLEYLFQRVREKSSILDTFLQVAEEVEVEEMEKGVEPTKTVIISQNKTNSC